MSDHIDLDRAAMAETINRAVSEGLLTPEEGEQVRWKRPSADHALAEAARAYMTARMAMGAPTETQETMIARLDAAYADLFDVWDQEQ